MDVPGLVNYLVLDETATNGKTDIHIFRYNGAIWQEVGRTMNLSES